MLSVIIPTLNASDELPRTFQSLLPGLMEDMIKEVIIVDAGSTDKTINIADAAGAHIIKSEPNRGRQLSLGAECAKADWFLFLHADTVLEENWHQDIKNFIKAKGAESKAAAFRFALDDKGLWPRILAHLVSLRCRLFNLPYGDQALLISRAHYFAIGGHSPIPLMEDVKIIRQIKQPITIFKTRAITSAARYKRDGYIRRSFKNLMCLSAYYRGVNINKIKRLYE